MKRGCGGEEVVTITITVTTIRVRTVLIWQFNEPVSLIHDFQNPTPHFHTLITAAIHLHDK